MIDRHIHLHKFKATHINKTRNIVQTENKFAHILYRFIPNILFNNRNKLLSVFTNGLAVLVAKTVSNIQYCEKYFDVINDTHKK